jgi:hypothetical protein
MKEKIHKVSGRVCNPINYEQLDRLIEYDEDTGLIKWKEKRSPRCKNGWFAGTIDKCDDGYDRLKIKIGKKNYLVSRIIWCLKTKKWPTNEIDHKNRNPLDNKWKNLREATTLQNNFNKDVSNTNKLGIKGVNHRFGKYVAQITIYGTKVHLGLYNTAQEASWAYEIVAKALHESFYYDQQTNEIKL